MDTQQTNETVWFIECLTGCTCCAYENHYRGPYRTEEDAKRRIAYFKSPDSKFWPLGSQYARRGVYWTEERQIEAISRGRCIIGSTVYEFVPPFVVVNPDGSVDDNDSERFDE